MGGIDLLMWIEGFFIGVLLTVGIVAYFQLKQNKKDFASYEQYWKYQRLKLAYDMADRINDVDTRYKLLIDLDKQLEEMEQKQKHA